MPRFFGSGLLMTPLALLLTSSAALAEAWMVDGAHHQLGFKVRHMSVSWVRSSFGKFEVTFETDGHKLKSIEGKVELASLDTEEPKREDHLRGEPSQMSA